MPTFWGIVRSLFTRPPKPSPNFFDNGNATHWEGGIGALFEPPPETWREWTKRLTLEQLRRAGRALRAQASALPRLTHTIRTQEKAYQLSKNLVRVFCINGYWIIFLAANEANARRQVTPDSWPDKLVVLSFTVARIGLVLGTTVRTLILALQQADLAPQTGIHDEGMLIVAAPPAHVGIGKSLGGEIFSLLNYLITMLCIQGIRLIPGVFLLAPLLQTFLDGATILEYALANQGHPDVQRAETLRKLSLECFLMGMTPEITATILAKFIEMRTGAPTTATHSMIKAIISVFFIGLAHHTVLPAPEATAEVTLLDITRTTTDVATLFCVSGGAAVKKRYWPAPGVDGLPPWLTATLTYGQQYWRHPRALAIRNHPFVADYLLIALIPFFARAPKEDLKEDPVIGAYLDGLCDTAIKTIDFLKRIREQALVDLVFNLREDIAIPAIQRIAKGFGLPLPLWVLTTLFHMLKSEKFWERMEWLRFKAVAFNNVGDPNVAPGDADIGGDFVAPAPGLIEMRVPVTERSATGAETTRTVAVIATNQTDAAQLLTNVATALRSAQDNSEDFAPRRSHGPVEPLDEASFEMPHRVVGVTTNEEREPGMVLIAHRTLTAAEESAGLQPTTVGSDLVGALAASLRSRSPSPTRLATLAAAEMQRSILQPRQTSTDGATSSPTPS